MHLIPFGNSELIASSRKRSWALLALSCASETPTSEDVPPQDPLSHITDGEVKRVLSAAMDKAGGLERWNQLASLQFTKDYSLLLESGEVENAAFQKHLYSFGMKHFCYSRFPTTNPSC